MADPTGYTITYDFSDYQASNPGDPMPATSLDNEFENIETSIGSLKSAIEDIRRSDGALVNEIVTTDSLDPTVRAGVGAGALAAEASAVAAAASSALDAEQTALDAAQTAADRIQTGIDAANAGAAASGFQYTSTGGTGSAYTADFTSDVTLVTGAIVRVRFSAINEAGCTFNPDGLGAKKILDGDRELIKGEFIVNDVATLLYNATADSAAGAWLVQDGLRTVLTAYEIPGRLKDQDYVLEDHLFGAEAMLKVDAVLSSGTATITPKYNTTAMTGGAISAVDTAYVSSVPSAANVGAATDQLVVSVSDAVSGVGTKATIQTWRRI